MHLWIGCIPRGVAPPPLHSWQADRHGQTDWLTHQQVPVNTMPAQHSIASAQVNNQSSERSDLKSSGNSDRFERCYGVREYVSSNLNKKISYCRDGAGRRSLRRSRSLKVTDIGTSRKPVCDFLKENNLHPISQHFQVIVDYWSNLCFRRGTSLQHTRFSVKVTEFGLKKL